MNQSWIVSLLIYVNLYRSVINNLTVMLTSFMKIQDGSFEAPLKRDPRR